MKTDEFLSCGAGIEPVPSTAMLARYTAGQIKTEEPQRTSPHKINEKLVGVSSNHARYGRFNGLDPVLEGPWLQVPQKGKLISAAPRIRASFGCRLAPTIVAMVSVESHVQEEDLHRPVLSLSLVVSLWLRIKSESRVLYAPAGKTGVDDTGAMVQPLRHAIETP